MQTGLVFASSTVFRKAFGALDNAYIFQVDHRSPAFCLGTLQGKCFGNFCYLNIAWCVLGSLRLSFQQCVYGDSLKATEQGEKRGKGSGKISACISSNYLILFFIRSRLGWLVHTMSLAAACPAAVCTGILGSFPKDEGHLFAERSLGGVRISSDPLQVPKGCNPLKAHTALPENLAVHQSQVALALQWPQATTSWTGVGILLYGVHFMSVLMFRKLYSYEEHFKGSLIKRRWFLNL